jgi:hypothetical protein
LLAEAIIRIGRPVVNSDLPLTERIRWLTDVDSENCKNYFQHVWVVECLKEETALHFIEIGKKVKVEKKETFLVDTARNVAFPIIYPNGGNPLHAQGVYPLPCYLMYDPHIKAFEKHEEFAENVLLPRFKKTICCMQDMKSEEQLSYAKRIAKLLAEQAASFVYEDKQLGILMVVDPRFPVYRYGNNLDSRQYVKVANSLLDVDKEIYLDGQVLLDGIIEARFDEAKTLGVEKNQVSTFTNRIEKEVVSIYNKSWLWLSSTWEAPKSIYWGEREWTKGIKIDRETYEAFLYGVQLLKQITVPLSNVTLKEMFAPHMNAEAKQKISFSSIEPIFGVPFVLPLLDGDSEQLYKKYKRILKNDELDQEALHMELLAALKGTIVPKSTDDYRLMLLYYSGDLSRGNIHIRAVIDDVIPSVASEIQQILKELNRSELFRLREILGLERRENEVDYRFASLPAMLANAYGPGYVWSSMQSAFHRKPLQAHRVRASIACKLTELANKQSIFAMRQELVFYYGFVYFLNAYYKRVLKEEWEGMGLHDFLTLAEKYHGGTITMDDLTTPETLGFVSGLALRQFSKSYGAKTKKDFINHRIMKFGSKLNPEMIWKNGLLRCEELARQWDLGIKENFRSVLAHLLSGFLHAQKEGWLLNQKEHMMTAFWSGYLIYDQTVSTKE